MDRDAVRNAVERALAGDVDALAAISSAPQVELVAAVGDRTLTLGAQALRLVLRGVGSGEIDAPDAQRWASFMQLGHFPLASADPIDPIEIDYAAEHEQEIADAVARLEEIGDVIDGEPPTAAEIQMLLKRLEA